MSSRESAKSGPRCGDCLRPEATFLPGRGRWTFDGTWHTGGLPLPGLPARLLGLPLEEGTPPLVSRVAGMGAGWWAAPFTAPAKGPAGEYIGGSYLEEREKWKVWGEGVECPRAGERAEEPGHWGGPASGRRGNCG